MSKISEPELGCESNKGILENSEQETRRHSGCGTLDSCTFLVSSAALILAGGIRTTARETLAVIGTFWGHLARIDVWTRAAGDGKRCKVLVGRGGMVVSVRARGLPRITIGSVYLDKGQNIHSIRSETLLTLFAQKRRTCLTTFRLDWAVGKDTIA